MCRRPGCQKWLLGVAQEKREVESESRHTAHMHRHHHLTRRLHNHHTHHQPARSPLTFSPTSMSPPSCAATPLLSPPIPSCCQSTSPLVSSSSPSVSTFPVSLSLCRDFDAGFFCRRVVGVPMAEGPAHHSYVGRPGGLRGTMALGFGNSTRA